MLTRTGGRVTAAPRALFLDFDGVVCDTERAARRSWEELYARSGTRLPHEVWHRMVGTASGAEVAHADLGARRRTPYGPGNWRGGRPGRPNSPTRSRCAPASPTW
jgi:hypothetical protein